MQDSLTRLSCNPVPDSRRAKARCRMLSVCMSVRDQPIRSYPPCCELLSNQSPLSAFVHAGPNKADLTGGWLNGGPAGNLKMTMPTAFTVSLLSWSMLAFPDGYNQANATSDTMSTIK